MKTSIRSLFGFCRLSRKAYSSAGSMPKGRSIVVAMFSVALLLTTSCKEQVVSTKLFRIMKKTSEEARNLGCETQISSLHGSLRQNYD